MRLSRLVPTHRQHRRKPREQQDGQSSAGVAHCSILIPASAMIGRNFSLSALIIAAATHGNEPTDVKPASLMRLATSGSLSVSAIASWSLLTTCGGVLGGATTANQSSCSTPA